MVMQQVSLQQLDRLSVSEVSRTGSAGGKSQSPFLRMLASAGREVLAQLLEEKNYTAGEVVFKEGDQGNAMFIVWSGRVAVVKGDLEYPTLLGYRGVGEVVGEMALLEDEPRSASVVAIENVRLLRITRDNFELLLSQNPRLGLSIVSTLSARLRAADDARKSSARSESHLIKQVSRLQVEKQQLLEMEQIRQDTIDLIIHDLRHPISSLFGAIKILEMVLPQEVLAENQQLLGIANSNCDHLQLMVESILDVSRMQNGNLQINRRSMPLIPFVREAVKRVQILADMENILVDVRLPAEEIVVSADEEKLYRVMGNLLNNALKYTPGGGQILVVVEPHADEVWLSVADNGPGIPEDSRERVFDRFAQLNEDGRRLRSGFGLGLAFCRIAVEAHQGKIWVEPGENDQGSRFVFSLPLDAPEPPGIMI
ncbi:MAG: hypothetical protein Kow0031_34830 [Anaerolineae bacterium]